MVEKGVDGDVLKEEKEEVSEGGMSKLVLEGETGGLVTDVTDVTSRYSTAWDDNKDINDLFQYHIQTYWQNFIGQMRKYIEVMEGIKHILHIKEINF